MTVTMQVDQAAMLAVSAPERIMAEDQHNAADCQLRMILRARAAAAPEVQEFVPATAGSATIEGRSPAPPTLLIRRVSCVGREVRAVFP